MPKIPVVAVTGPTASGKTALAVRLAQAYGGEVISADSMQIYRGMDIATAKPTKEEMRGVPHHLMDFLPPDAPYSVAAFCRDAAAAARDIVSRGKRVFLAGGTGLYADAFLTGMRFPEETDPAAVREILLQKKEALGIQALYDELTAVDPETAGSIHINNEKRVLRALEIYYLTNASPARARLQAVSGESDYAPFYIALVFRDRNALYSRINERVDDMIRRGLPEEARAFYASGASLTASQAIGYKELKPWLDGETDFETAVENLKRATRRYAKRQLTWLRRGPEKHYLYRDALSDEALFEQACRLIDEANVFEGGEPSETYCR